MIIKLLLAAALFLGSACAHQIPTSRDESKVLAVVNAEPITKDKYEQYLRIRSKQQAPIPDKTFELKIVLDEMIHRALLVQYAVEQKVSQELDVEPQLALMRKNENALLQGGNPADPEKLRDIPCSGKTCWRAPR